MDRLRDSLGYAPFTVQHNLLELYGAVPFIYWTTPPTTSPLSGIHYGDTGYYASEAPSPGRRLSLQCRSPNTLC
jgi:hypothetical protein